LYLCLPLLLAVVMVLMWTSPLWAADATSSTAESTTPPEFEQKFDPNPADQAWMYISSGLVLLMVPGLALFYGGMARRKNILGTMMHSMVAISIVGLFWVLFGYSLAFGTSQDVPGLGKGFIGWNPGYVGLYHVQPNQNFSNTTISIYTHCLYQGMFAIITPALISGAMAERIKFGPYCLFILLWSALVYSPLAHWVWAIEPSAADPTKDTAAGWLGKDGALDFAGGTVVHVAAGVSGLAAILLLRKRIGFPQHAMHPSSMVLTLFGAGLLWFGWFGFNGGSAGGSSPLAGSAIMATQIAAAAAGLTWMLVEWCHRKKPTALGFATGVVAGLVAITPASGFVGPMGALAIGVITAGVCYGAVVFKPFFKYDDSLDAFGVHGVGGFLGAVLTGVFAKVLVGDGVVINSAVDLSTVSVAVQFKAAAVAALYAFVVTAILVKGIDLIWGFCVDAETEQEGLDRAIHGEVGIDMGPEGDMAVVGAEPRAAIVPPGGVKRFTVVVEAGRNGELATAWTKVCQPTPTPPADFLKLYPFLTTVQGNRFHFRGGDPKEMSDSLQRLLGGALPNTPVKTVVEN